MSKPRTERNIQISETLFVQLCQHFLLDKDCTDSIRSGLDAKLNRIVEHDLYTKYKTSSSEEEKEKARIEYLEKKGIPTDFRW